MSLKLDTFKSSEVFDNIKSTLEKDPKLKQKIVEKSGSVYTFTLSDVSGRKESWYLDFKNGSVGRGKSPEGTKSDVELILSDSNFAGLIDGTQNSTQLFLSGSLKIRGDMMKAASVESILREAQEQKEKAKL